MIDSHESPDNSPVVPWLAEDLADIDAQISLTDAMLAAGERKLTIDLRDYKSVHRYVRELLLYIDAVVGKSKALEEKMRLLELLSATSPRKRGRGRPRKMTQADLSRTSKTKNKGGRPRIFLDEMLEWLDREAEATAEKLRAEGKPANIKAAVTARMRELLNSRSPGRIRVLPDVDYGESFYKPLMKYRAAAGKRLRSKSQNPPKNTPNSESLSRFMKSSLSPGVQQPPKRGKGKRGDANTSPTARGKGAHRVKP